MHVDIHYKANISLPFYTIKKSAGEVELTIEDICTGELVWFTVPVSEEIGKAIAKVVPACVYAGAVIATKEEN